MLVPGMLERNIQAFAWCFSLAAEHWEPAMLFYNVDG